MTDRVTFTGPYETRERSAATFLVSTREGAALAVPTNLYYRLEDDGTGLVLADWTPATLPEEFTGADLALAITPEQNRIVRESPMRRVGLSKSFSCWEKASTNRLLVR